MAFPNLPSSLTKALLLRITTSICVIAIALGGAWYINHLPQKKTAQKTGRLDYGDLGEAAQLGSLTTEERAPTNTLRTTLISADAPAPAQPVTTETLSRAENYPSALPIANIENHLVNNAAGTVVIIPQTHRYPGSNPEDAINDDAEIAQNEIYQIISHLTNSFNISHIMVEGELYGPVNTAKIASIADTSSGETHIQETLLATTKLMQMYGYTTSTVKSLEQSVDTTLKKTQRSLILQGAALVLKAQTPTLTLYGSENKATLDQGTILVRDYLYLQDRINQLAGTAQNTATLGTSFSTTDLLKLITDQKNALTNNQTLAAVNTRATKEGHTDLAEATKNLQNLIKTISTTAVASDETPTSAAPSRADNPYKTVTDKQLLSQKLTKAEQAIQSVIIDQRNRETADNFVKMLQENNTTTGILQFGAGHVEGMITEFNKRNISVIVITPNKVANQQ